MKVSVIVPTMDEENAIEGVIKEIPKGYEIVVVDNSTDRTAEISKRCGARVIKQKDRGKGRAMVLGAEKARGDIIVFIDGDGTYPAEKIPDLVEPIIAGRADAVNGVRIYGGSMKLANKFGNRFLSLVARLLYGRTGDLLTGMRAMKRKEFLKLGLKSAGFEVETEIHIRSSKAGLRTVEIPIEYKLRIGDTKLNRMRDGMRILRLLFGSIAD
jgi:glycosyltransferase involved in cell wall biosynthesis